VHAGNRDYVRKHPVATKRVLRAFIKATDLCVSQPEWVAQRIVDAGFTPRYDYALQTLKEISPGITHISMIYNPDNPAGGLYARSFQSAAGPLGMEPAVRHIHGVADIERAVAVVAAQPNGGIFVSPDVTTIAFAEQTVAAVARHRVPAIYAERVFVTKGGLVYYGSDRIEIYRGAASYVDRILRGEKPGDLPYQQPTKYELVINLQTAKAQGLTIPPKLLFTADEVIE
jgi:putative ABC transport system substrate-binding protein